MSIDWFTTAAQIINFLILIWLLKKLLFRPIISAMKRRELGLSARLQQVKTKMSEAQALKNDYEKHLQQLQKEKDEVLLQARQQAQTEKTKLFQRLNEEIQQKKNQFAAKMRKEQEQQGQLISRIIAEKSLILSQKILIRLSDQTLEQRITERFLKNLSDLSETEKKSIKQLLTEDQTATIITSFQTDEATRQQIQSWFHNVVPGSSLLFAQRDHLICGIALEAGGHSWEWNVDRYLTELGTELFKSPEQPS